VPIRRDLAIQRSGDLAAGGAAQPTYIQNLSILVSKGPKLSPKYIGKYQIENVVKEGATHGGIILK
jgi:hypothetical protein